MSSIVRAALALLVFVQSAGVHPISGRRYASPMGVGGIDWLERSEREREEEPTRALQIIGIKAGSAVADIGAGSGYYTMRLAELVGAAGTVYANDIQQGMLDAIRAKLDRTRVTNVKLVLGTIDDPKLPAASVDLALLVDVYHEFSQPQTMLRRIRAALRPGGRLVLLEFKKEDPRIPIRLEHKMSVAEAKLEVEAEGFALAAANGDLPWQHILVFTPRTQ